MKCSTGGGFIADKPCKYLNPGRPWVVCCEEIKYSNSP